MHVSMHACMHACKHTHPQINTHRLSLRFLLISFAYNRGALRASCTANKAAVDAHVHRAHYYGVARNPQQASLPPLIKEVDVS